MKRLIQTHLTCGLIFLFIVSRAYSYEVGDRINNLSYDYGVQYTNQKNINLSSGKLLFNSKYKFYLVEIWATWCHGCQHAFKHLNKVKNKYPNIKIIAYTQEDSFQNKNNILSYVEKQKRLSHAIEFDVLASEKQSSIFTDVPGYPTAYIIDGSGLVLWKGLTNSQRDNEQYQIDYILEKITENNFDSSEFIKYYLPLSDLLKKESEYKKKIKGISSEPNDNSFTKSIQKINLYNALADSYHNMVLYTENNIDKLHTIEKSFTIYKANKEIKSLVKCLGESYNITTTDKYKSEFIKKIEERFNTQIERVSDSNCCIAEVLDHLARLFMEENRFEASFKKLILRASISANDATSYKVIDYLDTLVKAYEVNDDKSNAEKVKNMISNIKK